VRAGQRAGARLFLHPLMAPTILVTMEETKSCLFCGRGVDREYLFCPHCGYEFGLGEDLAALLDEASSEPPIAEGPDYLLRLRTLQEQLSELERELDLLLRSVSRDP
jgi:hypothetical protein